MKNNCKIIAKYISTIIALIFIYNISLFLMAIFSSDLIYDQCVKSSKEFEAEGNMLHLPFFEQTDNSTDALMINEAYSIDSETPVESYLKVRKNYNKKITKYQLSDESQELRTYSQNRIKDGKPHLDDKYDIVKELSNFMNEKVEISVDYARYYHGNLVLYRPLLILFDVSGIRIIQLILFIILFIWLALELCRAFNREIMFAICLSLSLFGYFFVANSLQQAPIVFVLMIYSIIILKNLKKWDWNNMRFSAFIVGSLTCFFDFLTFPVLTLAIPLLIYCLSYSIEHSIKNKDLFLSVFSTCVIWSIGYAITWISKWIFCDLVLNTSIIQNAIEQIKYRSVGAPRQDMDNILFFMQHFILASIVTIVFVLFYDFLKQFHRTKKAKNYIIFANNQLIILFICLIPIFWSLITFNHFYNHIIYTFRNFTTVFIYIFLIFFEKEKDGKI